MGKEFDGVFCINKDDIVDALFVQERELVEGVGELGSGMLCRALEPLDALSGTFGEAEFAIEFCYAETVHGTWVECGGGFAKELDCLW